MYIQLLLPIVLCCRFVMGVGGGGRQTETQRERKRETDRERQRETERHTERQTERQTDRELHFKSNGTEEKGFFDKRTVFKKDLKELTEVERRTETAYRLLRLWQA